MKQWLKSLLAEDKKKLAQTEKSIESVSQRFVDSVWDSVDGRLRGLRDENGFIEPSLYNDSVYDEAMREASYQANREMDILRAGIIGAIITRLSQSNEMWDGIYSFSFDPVQLASREVSLLDNKIMNAKNDALNSIGSYIEKAKGTRSRRDVVRRDARQKIGILGSFTEFVSTDTLYETDRLVREKQFNASPAELMLYDGPDDSVTRDWCADHVGKAATPDYWETVQNDVGPQPPLLYGGGFNCRHRLIPVKREWLTTEQIIS